MALTRVGARSRNAATGLLLLLLAAPYATPQAQPLQDRAAAVQRRWTEYQELLESRDPVVRAEGLRAALVDENTGVQSNALWFYLQRLNTLPLEVVVQPGGRFGAGEVPRLDLTRMRMNAEARSLEGRFNSHGLSSTASGQVVASRLRLRYSRLRMPSRIGLPGGAPPPRREWTQANCEVTLTVNAARDALEGPLQCEGMSFTLPVRMPLG